MRQSNICLVSSHGGMRRILKKHLSPVDYIKKAVNAGTYYNEEKESKPTMSYRQRNGATVSIDKYPPEFEILQLHPPLPDPPTLSKKMKRLVREEEAARKKYQKQPSVDLLVKNYMKRYDDRVRATNPLTDAQKEESYYTSLLGIPNNDNNDNNSTSNNNYSSTPRAEGLSTAMGRKPNVLNHAYEFALKQHSIIAASEDDEGTYMSESDSMALVEELLAKEEQEERLSSRSRAQKVKEWREAKEKEVKEAKEGELTFVEGQDVTTSSSLPSTKVTSSPTSTIPSVLFSKPRTIQAMHIWGKRLKAVPYAQWSLGATTALDHWIAVDVLNMSNTSWNQLLDGEFESDMTESRGSSNEVMFGHSSRMKDIVSVRSTLFPETLIHVAMKDGDGIDGIDGGIVEEEEKDDTERSIDELLASLGGLDDDEDDDQMDDFTPGGISDDTNEEIKAMDMLDNLQQWRAKNVEQPFEEWDQFEQQDFNKWLKDYIALATTEEDGEVDLAATRDALLADPPTSREETDEFFTQIQDESSAEIFLHHLLQSKEAGAASTTTTSSSNDESIPEKNARHAMELFIDLPYSKQLSRLISIGKLRPIFDEYTTNSDRLKFMQQYGDLLLDGVEVEHLVSDPKGVITVDDIGDDTLLNSEEMADKDARYSIKMIPYGTDEFGTTRNERARALHRAWNMQKAGRARYEEYLFKSGKVPLKDDGKR